jgi:hypothetical protein
MRPPIVILKPAKSNGVANSSAYLESGQFTPHIATKNVSRINVFVLESCIFFKLLSVMVFTMVQ